MKNTITVIGGDLRTVKLVKMLAEENEITTYGLDQATELSGIANIKQEDSLEQAIKKSDIIIAPMPFSKDGNNINAQFSKSKITIESVIDCLNKKILIAGSIPEKIYSLAKEKETKVIDLMKQEELTVLNTIATAEGAIEVAMQETQKIIHGSKILILGFGRVGKATAQKFAGLSADVTCAVRKPKDFAWVEVYGYKAIDINKLGGNLSEFDIIINTPPTLILTKERLQHVKKDCLIIDLASKPGGVDVEEVKKLGIKFNWALALPGKVAPITAAEHIKKTLDSILKEI